MIIMQISRCMHFNRLSPIAFWELLRGKKALSLHQSTTKGRHATNGHRKWNYYSTTKGQHSSTLVVAVAPPLLKPLWRNSPPRGQGRETWTSGLSHVYHSPHLMQAGVLVKREKQLSVKCLLSWSLPDTSNNKHLLASETFCSCTGYFIISLQFLHMQICGSGHTWSTCRYSPCCSQPISNTYFPGPDGWNTNGWQWPFIYASTQRSCCMLINL